MKHEAATETDIFPSGVDVDKRTPDKCQCHSMSGGCFSQATKNRGRILSQFNIVTNTCNSVHFHLSLQNVSLKG